jgi:hypothetical protein
MTQDEARELFSDAHDEALAPDRAQAFAELLERDSGLAEEYRAFCQTMGALRGGAGDGRRAETAPNLLPGVQRRLRARSRGRFYGDRFAERAGTGPIAPLLWALLVLALVAVSWFALGSLDVAVPLK